MNWFALNVRSRQEQQVANCLSFKGYEVFVPVYRGRRRWSDRVKAVDLPLFPGYVFCLFDMANRSAPVITTPGVIRILGIGPLPQPVDPEEIKTIRQVVASRLPTGPWPYLHEGSRVTVRRGPLAGVDGLIVRLKSQSQLVVSITLLGRSMAVEVDPAWVTMVASGADSATLISRAGGIVTGHRAA